MNSTTIEYMDRIAGHASMQEAIKRLGRTRRTASLKRTIFRCQNMLLIPLLAIIVWTNSAWSQNGDGTVTPSLNTAQVVEAMQRHEQTQASQLRQYQAVRHYSLVYRGFTRTITANMEVEVQYQAGSGKSFRIISQSGSGALCQKVLKRALESEREASLDKSSTALTPENYRFELIGIDHLENRPAYILNVRPITPSKFLYEGKIWVDTTDFAVAKMEVQPAKNPSFWISRTLIHHTNKVTDGFWLPEQNQSETKVRIGGTAVMTIDYGAYRVVSQTESSQSTMPKSD